MEIVKLEKDRDRITGIIGSRVREGGVILYPTDTVYGLGCDPFNRRALSRIVDIKGRDAGKGLLLLIPDPGWLPELASGIDAEKEKICRRVWPGPVTFLFQASAELSSLVTGQSGKVGMRMPANRFLIECMNRISGPLVSTSANLSGKPAASKFTDLDPAVINSVDLAVDGGALEPGLSLPSSIVDLSGDKPILVREGEGLDRVASLGISQDVSAK